MSEGGTPPRHFVGVMHFPWLSGDNWALMGHHFEPGMTQVRWVPAGPWFGSAEEAVKAMAAFNATVSGGD